MTSIVSTESVASAAPGKRSASPAPPHWYESVGVGGLAVVAIQSEGFFGGAPFGPSLFAATVDRQGQHSQTKLPPVLRSPEGDIVFNFERADAAPLPVRKPPPRLLGPERLLVQLVALIVQDPAAQRSVLQIFLEEDAEGSCCTYTKPSAGCSALMPLR